MRYVLTAIAFVGALVVTGATAIVAVLVLAGPHADLLPMPLRIVVHVLCRAAVLAIPFLTARAVWRRTGRERVA